MRHAVAFLHPRVPQKACMSLSVTPLPGAVPGGAYQPGRSQSGPVPWNWDSDQPTSERGCEEYGLVRGLVGVDELVEVSERMVHHGGKLV